MTLLDTWFAAGQEKLPSGLIVFSKAASPPTGWQAFNDANDKLIIGAGSTYNPGNVGGSDVVVNYTGSTGAGGDHTGPTYGTRPQAGGGGINFYRYESTDGDHSHTLEDATYIPEKETLKLIKSTQENLFFPTDSVVMGLNAFDGLTITNHNNKLIGAANAIASISETAKLEIGVAGDHKHPAGYYASNTGGSYAFSPQNTDGNHSQDIPLTISENLNKVLLSLWTQASQRFSARQGMIAMWESLTPPPGWQLCNWLSDCFIKGVGSGSESEAPIGDGKITISALSGSVNHSVVHNHDGGQYVSPSAVESGLNYHNSYTWDHSHAISASQVNTTWLPPYYSLSFIQKIRN